MINHKKKILIKKHLGNNTPEWIINNCIAMLNEFEEIELAEYTKAKNNEVLDLVSFSLRIEDFHIGFEYLQYEMDSERYLNKGMIWKKKKYGFDSPRLHKIKELIDNGQIARCNES